MRKLIYIFFLLLAVSLLPACRSAKEVHHYDTLTIERNVVHEVVKHDTVTEVREVVQVVTVRDTMSEVEHVNEVITHHIYDTAGRVRETIFTERGKDKVRQQGTASAASVNATEVKAQGSTVGSSSRDTVTVQQGSASTEKKTPGRCPWWLWWAIGIALAMMVPALYKFYKGQK